MAFGRDEPVGTDYGRDEYDSETLEIAKDILEVLGGLSYDQSHKVLYCALNRLGEVSTIPTKRKASTSKSIIKPKTKKKKK